MLQIAPIDLMEGPCDMVQSMLTRERVQELLAYVPSTGALVWRVANSNRIRVGSEAGVVADNGRRYVSVDGERHLAHRIVWFHVKGMWPLGNVAPKNGDYLDTRIENLVEETLSQTARKGRRRVSNTSGVPGVSWDSGRQRWIAKITRDYKPVSLGRFKTKEEAIAAREAALGPDFNVVVSADDRSRRAADLSKRIRQRKLWQRTLRDAGGITGWDDIESFISDVGSAPKRNSTLAAVDVANPIGPGNFMWKAPTFDYSNREGRSAANKAHRASYPMSYRDRHLQKAFGITLAQYQEMADSQNGCCAICRRPETVMRQGKQVPLAVDHDHKTGANRGLLCTACNVGIGSFEDNSAFLRNAISYLERHKSGAEPVPYCDWLEAATGLRMH